MISTHFQASVFQVNLFLKYNIEHGQLEDKVIISWSISKHDLFKTKEKNYKTVGYKKVN